LDEAASAARHDLIVAADVFVYTADLEPVVVAAARILDPQGMLVFTVEAHNGEGTILGKKLRYAHGEDHVRKAVTAGGFDLLHLEPASTRTENGIPVPGLIVVVGSASTLPRSQP
jgi:predicted TPR repeat methyltransferase